MVSLQAAVLTLMLFGTGQTVLLDFYSDSCGPCRQMDPTIQSLAAKGYPIKRVNVDHNRALAARFAVRSIPCFVMVVDGREVDRVVGITDVARLEQMCTAGLAVGSRQPSPSNPPQAAAPKGRLVPIPAVPAESPWRLSGADQTRGAAPAAAKSDAELIAATVRLRITDPDGQSCGSGTIIDARGGAALIVTCGHIFRDSKGEGAIEVDLFGPRSQQRVPGRLIWYDLDTKVGDIGLLSIRVPGPVATVPVAPPGHRVQEGQPVASVGCPNGKRPSVIHTRINSLNKFAGPANLQVAGLPVEGRSGGGLFSRDGLLIGVCNAADPLDNEGLFAATKVIHGALDQAELSCIYRSPGDGRSSKAMVAVADPPAMPESMPQPPQPAPLVKLSPSPPEDQPSSSPASQWMQLSSEERAALEEIRRRNAEGYEVILIARSLSDPKARSEIFTLNSVSPEFFGALAADSRARSHRRLTSLEIPRKSGVAAGGAIDQPPPSVGETRRLGSPRLVKVPGKPGWQPRWARSGAAAPAR